MHNSRRRRRRHRPAFLPSTPIRLQATNTTITTTTITTTTTPRHPQQSSPCRPTTRPRVTMLDQSTLIGAAAAFAGIGGGIALVAWTESQGKRTEARDNLQPCVECNGDKRTSCNVCKGDGTSPIDPDKTCTFCDGVGDIKCFNCAGSGVQPRYLDRLSPEDFMD